MAGLINVKKASPPAGNPDSSHSYVGVDSADNYLYTKDSTGTTRKYTTTTDAQALVNTHANRTDNPHATTASQVGADPTGSAAAAQAAAIQRANHTGTQTASTISDFTEAAQDAVGGSLTDSASIDFTYNDAGNTITAAVIPGGVNHNSLLNGGGTTHVDHATVSINAGTSLNGGGDITATRTINHNAFGTAGTYGSASTVPVFTTEATGHISGVTATAISILAAAVSDFASAVRSTALTGLSLVTSQTIAATDTVLQAMGYLQAQITVLFNRVLTAGYGLTGGGNLTADRAFAVSLTTDEVSATNTITTTSASAVLMTGMTITPPAGTYMVLFKSTLSGGNNDSAITASIYSGGTLETGSESPVVANVSGGIADPNTTTSNVTCFCITTVNGSQAIEGRWRRAAGTATASNRHLQIIRIA